MYRSGLVDTLVSHANMKGLGLTPLFGDRPGFMPSQLKTKQSFWQSNATFLKLCFLFDMVYFVSLWKKARRVLHFGNAVKDLTIGDQTNRFNRLPVLLYRFCISTCNSTYNINIDHMYIQDKDAILSFFCKVFFENKYANVLTKLQARIGSFTRAPQGVLTCKTFYLITI